MGDSCPLINLLHLFQLAICVVLVIMVPSQEVTGCLGGVLCAHTRSFYRSGRSSLPGVSSVLCLMGAALVCEEVGAVSIQFKRHYGSKL